MFESIFREAQSAERIAYAARRGLKRGSRNAERGILFCANGQKAKPAKLAQPAKRTKRRPLYKIPLSPLSLNLLPLPWWEGIKGRGITPTLTLPRQGGGKEGEEFLPLIIYLERSTGPEVDTFFPGKMGT